MSFSVDAKLEAMNKIPSSPCCRAALLYGMLQCSRGFSMLEMSLQTELPGVADLYSSLLWKCCRVPTLREEGTYSIVTVSDEWRPRVLKFFSHSQNDVSSHLNRGVFDCDNCQNAYLRGVFLVCGAVSEPQNDYHLELNIPSLPLSRAIGVLLEELDQPAKFIRRKGDNVLYYKRQDQVEDFLTRIGATDSSLAVMATGMVKSLSNAENRARNCDMANLGKTAAASADQRRDVAVIEEHGRLKQLPPELRTLAELRRDYPIASLRELGDMLEPPLSRAGVCHRFRRIHEIATEILEENTKKD